MKRTSAKHNAEVRHQKHSSSNKVLRAFTFVLTPFLILVIVLSSLVLALSKPYAQLKPYTNLVFDVSAKEAESKSVRTLNKYRDDDAPLQIKEIQDDETNETHTMVYPYYGDYYASITCENAGMNNIKVYSGTTEDVLTWGAGWYNGSVYIGHVGNVVIAGHNHTSFYRLPNCKIGDIVTLDTSYCKLTYIVSDIEVFHETDLTYIRPSDRDILTMYTCWNNGRLGMSEYRLAVICDCVEREWKEVKE